VDAFNFVFSLFGLLLGLSLVEVLSGLVRALKSREHIRVGLLAPMLGLLVMIHITTFWDDAWRNRETIPVNNIVLLVGVVITSIYYYAASFAFPDRPEEWPDLDDYYDWAKKFVLGGVIVCQFLSTSATMALYGRGYSLRFLLSFGVFGLLFAAPIFIKNRRASVALLGLALTVFTAGAVITSL
jgi:hypothetical protein